MNQKIRKRKPIVFPKKRRLTGKVLLIALISFTSVFPLLFLELDAPSADLVVLKLLSKVGSLVGAMFLIWQFFLGFRGIVSRIFPHLFWILDVHKWLGKYGLLLIPLHPISIGTYYFVRFDQNVFEFRPIGFLALIAFIVVTSAFFRDRMGFYPWLYTHLSSYLVPPFLFIHSFSLGSTIRETSLWFYWWGLTGIVGLLFGYRILHKIGIFAVRHRVVGRERVADQTTEVRMAPEKGRIVPAIGQFVYIRERIARNAHPYTVSHYDAETGELGITAKALGPQSGRLQHIARGTLIIVDGPYGVFTRMARATDSPFIMVAGGIGITPFRWLWQDIERRKDRKTWLFYGSGTYRDIAYKNELDGLKHVRVVHVLSSEPDFPGEKGFITIELINKYVEGDVKDCQVLICGPPVMVVKLEEALMEAGVSDRQIRHELFSS